MEMKVYKSNIDWKSDIVGNGIWEEVEKIVAKFNK